MLVEPFTCRGSTLFALIFKPPRALRRRREGPLADERARSWAQLAEGGVPRSTLRPAAFFLLDFAARIDLTGDQKVSAEQIEKADDDGAHRKRPSEARPFEPYGSRETFRSVASAWLRFLGRWQPPQLPPPPDADLIRDFALSLRQERGLPESTITLRVRQEVLRSLGESAGHLTRGSPEISGGGLGLAGTPRYTRRSPRAYVEALRAFFRRAERRGWGAPGISAAITVPRIAPYRGFRPGGLWPSVGPQVRALGIRVEPPGPPGLRHACAARLLSPGLSYKQIADHWAHRRLEATRIYAKVDLARLRKVGNFDWGCLL